MSFGSTLFRFPCSHPAWPQTTKKNTVLPNKITLQHSKPGISPMSKCCFSTLQVMRWFWWVTSMPIRHHSRSRWPCLQGVVWSITWKCYWSPYRHVLTLDFGLGIPHPFEVKGRIFFFLVSCWISWLRFVYERFVDLKKKVLHHFLIFLRIPFITEDHIHPAGFLVFQCTNDGRCDILRIESNTLGRIFVGLGTRMDDTMAASCKKKITLANFRSHRITNFGQEIISND